MMGGNDSNQQRQQQQQQQQQKQTSPQQKSQQQQPTDKKEDEFAEFDSFLKSMKVGNTTSSDMDILVLKVKDRVGKNEFSEALKILKQFVYISIEPITKTTIGSMSDSNTYNSLYEKYHIPSLNKIEELYQLTRSKTEETIRTNNQESLINVSMILSIVQQMKQRIIFRQQQQQQQQGNTSSMMLEEDEGLALYIQFQRKIILQESGPLIKEMIKVNQSLDGKDIKTKVKIFDNCLITLKKVLSSIVDKVSDALDVGEDQWKWNNVLESRFQTKLNEWNPSLLSLPLHNQSAIYLDQIYNIFLEKIKDTDLLTKMGDVNFQLEELITNLEYSQPIIDNVQSLLSVDEILNKISTMSEISHRYIGFIQENSGNQNIAELNNMKSRIQEIMTNYIGLESQYFQLSFSYAIYMDDLRKIVYNLIKQQINKGNQQQQQQSQQQHQHQNQLQNSQHNEKFNIQEITTSSMVDDIFFVFRKVIGRSISSLSSPTTCAILNLSTSNFDILYIPFLEKLLEFTYIDDFDKRRDYYLVILNDLYYTKEFMKQMQDQLKETTSHKFKNQDDVKMITLCIVGDGFVSLEKRINQMLKESIEKIVAILGSSLNQSIWPFRNINYEITDVEFENYEINDPFAMDFMNSLFNVLEPYKRKLAPQNFDLLVHLISVQIANILEGHIKQKKFNQLGGIQLSKDVRKIIEFLCNLTSEQNVRHKFTRLSQITHLLTLDKVTDVLEYWGQEGYIWKLDMLEIKLVLGRRSDFMMSNAIHNLKFT
ncbi:hypothetical protein CYY_003217 [Polysphondylium violaceum]|uniref:Dilute domain-containing protein n=1 Tax=Polysphondylium violaceum TaxID=133409 RepID=A0A8J4UUH4_9MYCE|nr:hypothetical protein CYY_003217 [Polysphondylium violaceum]